VGAEERIMYFGLGLLPRWIYSRGFGLEKGWEGKARAGFGFQPTARQNQSVQKEKGVARPAWVDEGVWRMSAFPASRPPT